MTSQTTAAPTSGGFPAPRYAVSDEDVTEANLLRIAREMLRQHDNVPVFPRATIDSGDRVLISVPGTFDRRVLDALSTAISEITTPPDVMVDNTPVPFTSAGEDELRVFRYYYVGPKTVEHLWGFEEERVHAFCLAGGYDVLLYAGGGSFSTPGSRDEKTFRWYGARAWDNADAFAAGLVNFPPELQRAIDAAAYSTLRRARRVRITDPEGTEISWSLRTRDFELMEARLGLPIAMQGHLNAVPWGTPLPEDAQGVIAGTINHTGAFPHIAVHMTDSSVARIEGGGRYGEGWWEAIQGLAHVEYPGHPGPGWSWLMECAVGTNPKALRPRSFCDGDFGCCIHDRLKAGTLHFGIGASLVPPGEGASREAFAADRRTYREFIEANELPDGHHHVHTYFANLDVETHDGENLRLIDGGRLLALDDAKVREVAQEHGDPDQLLDAAWVPAMPGINDPGEYSDYAADPLTWIKERSELVSRPSA